MTKDDLTSLMDRTKKIMEREYDILNKEYKKDCND